MPIMPPTGGQDPNNLMGQQPGSLPELSPEGLPVESTMSQEEMRAEIDRMITKVNDKEQGVKAKISTDKFKFDAMKSNLIRSLFDILKKAGVDPGNPSSIKEFLAQLQQRNPDLYSIFEIAFNDLIGSEQGQEQPSLEGGMPMQPMTMPGGAPEMGGLPGMPPGGMPQGMPPGMPPQGGGAIPPVGTTSMPQQGMGGMPDKLKNRPGKKRGLLKKFSNLSNKVFRGK